MSNDSVFSMIDRSKSAWFTWVDIAELNGGQDMTLKIRDIRAGEAGQGKAASRVAAVFFDGIPKPLGCRVTNLKSLVALHGTDKVAGLRGKLVTLYIGEDRNPRYNPKDTNSTEEPRCKCVRIRKVKPSPAQLYSASYNHAAAMEAFSTAEELSQVEAIRLALVGQKPPPEHHDEIKAAIQSATDRIRAAADAVAVASEGSKS